MANEIATIEQEHLVTQSIDWDVLETHDELYEIMEQEPNPDTGNRWWSARKFAEKMEIKWDNFKPLLKSAIQQIHPYFGDEKSNFPVYRKVRFKSDGQKYSMDDYRLSTYAIYLILMITRKDTEFVRKAKANFSMLTEVGKKVVENKSVRKMMAEQALQRLSSSRITVSERGSDATDAIQDALNIKPGTPGKQQILPDGSNPFRLYRAAIKLLMTGLYPYEIKKGLNESIKIPSQDLMPSELLECESLMHDRISLKLRKATRAAKKKTGPNWNGMSWDEIMQIVGDVGKQAVDDCFAPDELNKILLGSDVGTTLLKARDLIQKKLVFEESTQQIEYQNLPDVVRNPDICHGKPTIEGTRWPVQNIVDLVNASSVDEILEDFEGLTQEMIDVALQWAKEHPDEISA